MKNILLDFLQKYTDTSEQVLNEVIEQMPIKSFRKGTILIHQGEIPKTCYIILKGMIHQYSIDEEGNKHTSNFYTENQIAAIFHQQSNDEVSKYDLACFEDTILVEGDLASEDGMYQQYPFLETAAKKVLEETMAVIHGEYADFIASTPEQRYLSVLNKRPDLAERIPQHLLASYLGMKPESLSRIRRRLDPSK